MNRLLYLNEHLACYNYQRDQLPIEGLKVAANQSWEGKMTEHKMIFVMEGKCRIVYENRSAKVVTKGEMFLLPRECRYRAYPEEDTFFIVVCLRGKISFCDLFSLEQLSPMKTETENAFNPLPINDRIGGYLQWTFTYISDGLRCCHFFDLKLKELFFLLRGYYSKEDLTLFFYPLLTINQSFTDFVYQNHQKVKTVQELARLACMSLSNFKRQFRKSFGDSPYHWMIEKKSTAILHDINNSVMNLKAIMNKYDFSSPSQFNDFCKAQFGQTPGQIRREKLPEPGRRLKKTQKCLKHEIKEPI